MYVCINTHTHTHTYVHAQAHTHTFTHTCIRTCRPQRGEDKEAKQGPTPGYILEQVHMRVSMPVHACAAYAGKGCCLCRTCIVE